MFDAVIEGESNKAREQRYRAAVAICAGCPVKASCDAECKPDMDEGVWAGQVLAPRKLPTAGSGNGSLTGVHAKSKKPREHGTERGYRQHSVRNDMPPCQPCRDAHQVTKAARAKAVA